MPRSLPRPELLSYSWEPPHLSSLDGWPLSARGVGTRGQRQAPPGRVSRSRSPLALHQGWKGAPWTLRCLGDCKPAQLLEQRSWPQCSLPGTATGPTAPEAGEPAFPGTLRQHRLRGAGQSPSCRDQRSVLCPREFWELAWGERTPPPSISLCISLVTKEPAHRPIRPRLWGAS